MLKLGMATVPCNSHKFSKMKEQPFFFEIGVMMMMMMMMTMTMMMMMMIMNKNNI